MFVPLIGITGHRPSGFSNIPYVRELCTQVVEYCRYTYHHAEFNLGGCVGADSWVAQECMRQGAPFNLLLPFPADIQSQFWNRSEKEDLEAQVLAAKSVEIVGPKYKVQNYHIRDRQIVDRSHMVICFWQGNHSGGTFNTIDYAIKNRRPVFNALNELQRVKF